MTDKQRSAYQREMDQIHVPKAKADETLRMMLEENRRLRIKEAERGEKRRISRWIPAAGAAAAITTVLDLIATYLLETSSLRKKNLYV